MKATVHREMVVALLVAGMVGLEAGFTGPLVSLRLAQTGTSHTVIGLVGALPAAGFLVAAPFSTLLLRRFGGRPVLVGAMVLAAAATLALAVVLPLGVLALVRFLAGAGAGVLVVLGEAWVNLVSPSEVRGRVIAVYGVLYTVAQAGGPVVVSTTGLDSVPAVTVTALLQLSPAVGVIGAPCRLPRGKDDVRLALWPILRATPIVMLGMAAFAFLDGSVATMLPLFGAGAGMDLRVVPLLVSAVLVGDIFLEVPIGWAADHVDLTRLVLGCCAILVAVAVALPWVITTVAIWPALLLFGGASSGLFVLSMYRLGRDFHGSALVTANAAAAGVTGIGNGVGPSVTGVAMDVMGPAGLPVCFGAVPLVLAAALAGERWVRSRHSVVADTLPRDHGVVTLGTPESSDPPATCAASGTKTASATPVGIASRLSPEQIVE